MALAQPQEQEPLRMTESEYLEFERQSEERHEFVNGSVIDKESGGWAHALISVSTSSSLHQQLQERDCIVVSMMMRLWIEASSSFRYPDIMVICGNALLKDEHDDNIINPTIIIEVLTPDNELDDRTTKLYEYLSIESLQSYVLISG